MTTPYPSPVPTWRNDAYAEIKPEAIGGAHAGKTVVIAGAGSGIGRATAIALSEAGVGKIFLAGRTKSSLEETQKLLPSSTSSVVIVCDVIKEEDVEHLASTVGAWDILVMSTSSILPPRPITEVSSKEYWSSYEGNVKSLILFAHAFLQEHRPKAGASFVALTSGSMVLPPSWTKGQSDYQVSKLAQVKTIEYLATENEQVSFYAVHPGLVDTKTFRVSGADPSQLPMDKPELAAHFISWIASPKGKFLNGRMVFANWDVTELQRLSEKIATEDAMKIGYPSWPFNLAPGNNWWEIARGKSA